VFNFIVLILGVTMAGYGAYLVATTKGISVLSGIAIGLGVVDTIMGLLLACFGASSLFFLRLYGLVIGLLELAQISAAVMFIMPQTREQIINSINPPIDIRNLIEEQSATTGYILLGVCGFQAVTLFLVFVQACLLDRGFDEAAAERATDNESLLGKSGGYLSTFGYGDRESKNKDRFGALADEESAPSAADRYRTKAEKYYTKYGKK
jgi:hypothetical protein